MLDHHCRGRAEHFTVAESRYWFRLVVVGNAGFFFLYTMYFSVLCVCYVDMLRFSYNLCYSVTPNNSVRGGSRAAATSKMEHFVIIVNGFQPLTIITKRFILDVAAALDPPLS